MTCEEPTKTPYIEAKKFNILPKFENVDNGLYLEHRC